MLPEIKEKLITNTDALIQLLEEYGFEKISLRVSEIRCARDAQGGANNIQIHLTNNDGAYVNDYARGFSGDIISLIMKERGVDFKTVLGSIKKILGLSDTWQSQKKVSLFGGWYDTISGGKCGDITVPTYPETILDKYDMTPNRRWAREGITIAAQEFYNVGYDIESQRIIFPIRSAETNEIIGIKSRRNYETDDEFDPKYLYLTPCQMSQTLFNYSESYGDLYGNEVWVTESEKTSMLFYSYGLQNVVSIGSHTLSQKQAQLLLQLNPKKIIMALDEGLSFEETERNLKLVKDFTTLRDIQYYYWDTTLDPKIKGTKCGPADNGKAYLEKIKAEQLKPWEEESEK